MELISHHQSEKLGKGLKETPRVRPLPRIPLASIHLGWAMHACATRKDSELEWLAKDHPETNPITIKLETVSHAAEQFSWVPLPYCSPPGCPFPIKSLALSRDLCVSSDNSFPSVRQEPSFGPWKGSPFLQQRLQPVTKVTTSWSFLIFCNFKDDLKSFQCP